MTDTVGQKPDTSVPAPPWPELDARQMRMIDDLAEGIGLGLLQMMENAGRALALVASERFLGGQRPNRRVPSVDVPSASMHIGEHDDAHPKRG